jgi:hypothetical protein
MRGMAGQTNSPRTAEDARIRKRVLLRLAFGQAQVIGATAALVLLLQGGMSAPAIWAAVLTGIVGLTSIVLFRLVWREEHKNKQGPSPVQGIFHWPPKT